MRPAPLLAVAGLAAASFGLGLLFEVAWVADLWIWPRAAAPNHAFVGAVALSAAALLLWLARSGWWAAGVPLLVNALVATSGTALALVGAGTSADDARVRVYAWIAGAAAAASALGLLLLRGRTRRADAPPAPPVQRSFAAFALLFLGVGVAETTGLVEAFPWPLSRTAAQVYGSIALGAAAFFLHLALVPSARSARGALLGFLVYDLAVLLPLANVAPATAPERVPSLVLYAVVLLWSGGLALWALLRPHGPDVGGRR